MPQEFLDDPQIGPAVEEVSGEGMAQHMGMNPFLNTGEAGVFGEGSLDAPAGKASAIAVNK
jgi:hypothetical protein